MQKEFLYKQLGEILSSTFLDKSIIVSKAKALLDELNSSLSVQMSSSQLIRFLVQDLLDYSQIRSKGFRKNNKQFNIITSVKQIMSIQQMKADSIGIKFHSVFTNIKEDSVSEKKYSPMVIHDEHRI